MNRLMLAAALSAAAVTVSLPLQSRADSSVAYPNAGWLPYTKGPMVTPVAAMYGASPLTTCAIRPPAGQAALGSTCLVANSADIVGSIWGRYQAGAGVFDQLLGGTSVYRTKYDSGKRSAGATTYFQSTSADPQFCVPPGPGRWNFPNASGNVHIPAGAMPQMNSDHHLYIYDTTTKVHWSAWDSGRPGETTAKCANGLPMWGQPAGEDATPTGSAGTIDTATEGGSGPANTEGIGLAGTAGNISLEWSIRAQDVLAGRIPHALVLEGNCDTQNDRGRGIYWYPVLKNKNFGATDNKYFCSSNQTNLDYGAHVWLDTAPSPSLRGTANCDVLTYAILRALNEFGAYKNDIGPGKTGADDFVSFLGMADINDTYDGNPFGYTTANSPWHQVLSAMYASGGVMNNKETWTDAPKTGGRYQMTLPVTPCGINMASHMHVLIAPTPN